MIYDNGKIIMLFFFFKKQQQQKKPETFSSTKVDIKCKTQQFSEDELQLWDEDTFLPQYII